MPQSKKIFLQAVKKAKNVLISTHIFPDADGIGSQIALGLALKRLGINISCVNEKSLPERYRYLNRENIVISQREYITASSGPLKPIDLFIVVDTNTLSRIGEKMRGIGKSAKSILFIDHHPSSKSITAAHCINKKRAATGEIVAELIEALKIDFSRDIAEALYVSILIDTNCFRYPTVSSHTHRLVAKLLKSGLNPSSAYQQIYGTKDIKHIQLLGKILGQIKSTKDKQIAWLTITDELLKKYHANAEDTSSFINYLLVLDQVKVVCVFRQIQKYVKVSLRSIVGVDVEPMAQALGGGGHHHSAATLIKGTLPKVTQDSIRKIQIMLKNLED